MRAFAVVSLVLVGATSATAHAQPSPRPQPAADARPGHAIGPIALAGSGEVPAQFVDKLRAEAQRALEGSEVRVVAGDAVAAIVRTMPDLATCTTRDCVARFAIATAATRVVTIRVTVSGQLFDIALELLDDQGRPRRQRTLRCVACTLGDAISRTATAVRSLTAEDHDDTVAATIRSRPTDAAVTIDGEAVGTTPWAGSLTAGPHTIGVAGPRTEERQVFVEAGTALELSLDLGGTPRRFGWMTYAAAGVGVAALVGGVTLLTLDGDGTCGQPSCPQMYETTGAGWGLTAVGVAALGAAGWMFWRDRQGDPAATLVPTQGGVAAVVAGRF